MATATLTAIAEPPAPDAGVPADRGTYTCPECGHVLRVFGRGRHRVFFEPADTGFGRPVMDRACPACGHGIPAHDGVFGA